MSASVSIRILAPGTKIDVLPGATAELVSTPPSTTAATGERPRMASDRRQNATSIQKRHTARGPVRGDVGGGRCLFL